MHKKTKGYSKGGKKGGVKKMSNGGIASSGMTTKGYRSGGKLKSYGSGGNVKGYKKGGKASK